MPLKIAIFLCAFTNTIFSFRAYSLTNEDVSCEMINRPIDCRRLTVQECEEAKRKQEILNINRQLFCSTVAVQKAMSAGGGGGSGNGGNFQDGTEGEEGTEGQEGTEGEEGTEGTKGEEGMMGADGNPNTTTESPSTPSINSSRDLEQNVSGQDITGTAVKWGNGALCDVFKSAYTKAESEEAKTKIREQAQSRGC